CHLRSGPTATPRSTGYAHQGLLIAKVPVWIIGNQVRGLAGTNQLPPILASSGTGTVQIIGNRVAMGNGGGDHEGIDVDASYALIAGNIIQVNHDNSASGYDVYGIRASSSTYAIVVNNIIHNGYVSANVNSASAGIYASGRILGNIVLNLSRSYFGAIRGLGIVEITNNLCYGNYNNASCGSSAITTDPLLDTDLKPTAGSPAINAGPDDFAFADLDRSRNDIGAYGGPWNIEQYDLQRDPLNYAPYVFPLFKANSAFSDGSIEVRALGVARLR
ncbi:MAG TPA: hypothetical protein PK018_02210, partial [Candidatus Competibacter sp.]|nr:hypothetical protein [Candidatus Competibacter sp.]